MHGGNFFFPFFILESEYVENFQETARCQNCTHTFFHDESVSSIIHVYIPEDMLDMTKKIPLGETVKVICLMEYSEIDERLIITAEMINPISKVEVLII